jgi:hypothetical protein
MKQLTKSLLLGLALVIIGGALGWGLALRTPESPTDSPVGALTSPDIPSPWLKWGGVRQRAAALSTLKTGTTTICALQAPNATSTLLTGALRLDVSSTTATTVTIAKGAHSNATTSLIREASVSANAKATVPAASSTVSALEQTNRTFAPNEWLVMSLTGGTGTFSPTGACNAVLVEN